MDLLPRAFSAKLVGVRRFPTKEPLMDAAKLEAARVAAMDVATLATSVKGTLTGVQNAQGTADFLLDDARTALKDARLRLDAAERLLTDGGAS